MKVSFLIFRTPTFLFEIILLTVLVICGGYLCIWLEHKNKRYKLKKKLVWKPYHNKKGNSSNHGNQFCHGPNRHRRLLVSGLLGMHNVCIMLHSIRNNLNGCCLTHWLDTQAKTNPQSTRQNVLVHWWGLKINRGILYALKAYMVSPVSFFIQFIYNHLSFFPFPL